MNTKMSVMSTRKSPVDLTPGCGWGSGLLRLALITLVVFGAGIAEPALADDAALADDDAVPEGQALFLRNKCNSCHLIESLGIERTKDKTLAKDLSNVGNEREADWMTSYVRREIEVEGKKHKKPWKGTDEDLAAIVEWLSELKAEAEAEAGG